MEISVLGTLKLAVLYASKHRAITSTEPIATLLSAALAQKESMIGCYVPSTPNPFVGELIPCELQNAESGSIEEYEGRYYQIGKETMEYLPDFERIQSWQGLWHIAKEVLDLNSDGEDLPLMRSQKELNQLYDQFVSKFGDPQSKNNRALFRGQAGYGVICSLLIDGKKSAIFFRRTVAKSVEYMIETAQQAYSASLNQFGKVDVKWIAKQLNLSLVDAIAQLREFVYYDGDFPPQDPIDTNLDDWRDRNDYISGNVWARLKKVEAWYATPDWLDIELYLDVLRHNQPLPCVPIGAIKNEVIEELDLADYLSEDDQRDMVINEITILMGASIGKLTERIYESFARFLFCQDYESYEDDVQQFYDTKVYKTYQAKQYSALIKVIYFDKARHDFKVKADGSVQQSGRNVKEWSGGQWRDGIEIFEICLADRNPIVYDTVTQYVGGTKVTRQVENKEGTAACIAAKKKMLRAWDDWIWSDLARAVLLTNWYNSTINVYKVPTLDGSYLTFPGVSDTFNGKPLVFQQHQLDGVERVIRNSGIGTGLYHSVGAGKTLSAAMVAMKLREWIVGHKTVIVVLKSTITQFVEQFRDAFPQAVLLVRSPDTDQDLRREFLSRLAFEDFDCAICTKEDFEKIKYSAQMEEKYTKTDLTILEKSQSTKKNHKQKVEKEEKLRNYLSYLKSGKDDGLYWTDLGLDCVIFDEAHCLLNIQIKSTLRNVAGIPSGDGSRQGNDALLKFHDMYRRGKRVVLMTGTYLVNTIAQMYSNQLLLQPHLLTDMGLSNFDAWRGLFGLVVMSLEISATGRLKKKERFSTFNNMIELRAMCAQSMDVRTKEDLNLPSPRIRHIVLSSPPHASQIAYMNSLVARALLVKNKEVDPKDDNMLVITNDGIKSCMHMALVDPDARDWINHKLNACAWNVWKIWETTREIKATQLIFSDLSTPKKRETPYKVVVEGSHRVIYIKGQYGEADQPIGYAFKDAETTLWYNESLDHTYRSVQFPNRNDACMDLLFELDALPESFLTIDFTAYQYIKQVCVALGMPDHLFQFIHDHEDDKRDLLFEQVKSGDISVIMGSTEKLGTGVNVQDRLIAIHKIDVPWTPSRDEQRVGRIERPGSMFLNHWVYDFQYLTQGSGGSASIDGFKAQALSAKAKGFRDAINPHSKSRKCSDMDVEPITYEQMKAIASSDPRIMEKFKAEGDLAMLLAEQRAWEMNRHDLERAEINLPKDRIDVIDSIALIKESTIYVAPFLVKPEPVVDPVPVPVEGDEVTGKTKKVKAKKVKAPILPIDQIIGLDRIACEGDAREEYLEARIKEYGDEAQLRGLAERKRKIGTYCGCDIISYIPSLGFDSLYKANGFIVFPNGCKISISNIAHFGEIKRAFSQVGSTLQGEERRLLSIESKIDSVEKELQNHFVDEDGISKFDTISHLRVVIDELETIFQQEASEQQFALGDTEEYDFEPKSRPAQQPEETNPAIIKAIRETDYTNWFREEDNYDNWLVEMKETVQSIIAPKSNLIEFPDIKRDYGIQEGDRRLGLAIKHS